MTPCRKTGWGGLGIVLLTLAFIGWKYGNLLTHLGSPLVIEPYRDGIKTYLNAIWHARFSPSVTLYDGMNYPYAEHIVAATELPGVAILLRLLEPVFPALPDEVFSVIHLLLTGSILACAWLLYDMLRRWELPAWFAVPAALFITVLAPQNLRFVPHMGLAPLFVVPGMLALLLAYHRRPAWKASVGIALFIAAVSLLHFYFFAITAGTAILFFLFRWFMVGGLERRTLLRGLGQLGLAVGVPTVLFYSWLVLGDPVTGRNEHPWGFLQYHATWQSVFTSPHLPLWQWFSKHIAPIPEVDFEGWAYVGLVAGLFVVIALLKSLLDVPLGRAVLPGHASFRLEVKLLLWPALLLLVLSFSWPFRWPGWEWLLDYCGPLEQFRSTGRFAWVFYFVINVVAVTAFYRWAGRLPAGWLATTTRVLVLVVLGLEAWQFAHSPRYYQRTDLREITELMPGKRFIDRPGVEWENYQAIVPLPYFNVGNDHYLAIGGAESVQKSLVLSVQTGIPITGAMLTRSSPMQAFKQLQLVSEPYRRPAIFEEYPDQRALLILASHVVTPADSGRFEHLCDSNRLLLADPAWSLYAAPLDDFDRRIVARTAHLQAYLDTARLFAAGDFLADTPGGGFIFENFDTAGLDAGYFGSGGFAARGSEYHEAFRRQLKGVKAGTPCVLSAWVYVGENGLATSSLILKHYDEQGQVSSTQGWGVGFQTSAFDPAGWVLVECHFEAATDDPLLGFGIHWPKAERNTLLRVDEVLVKPKEMHLYRRTPSLLWFDNRHWRLDATGKPES